MILSVCGLLAPFVVACKAPAPLVDPAKRPGPAARVVGPQPVDDAAVSQKRDTGTYPTFSQPLTAAAPQMGENEAHTMAQKLSRLETARRNGAMSQAEYQRRIAELRALAERQHPVATPAASQ